MQPQQKYGKSLGTNRYIKDTDNDELTDYEEIFTYNTNPLIFYNNAQFEYDYPLDDSFTIVGTIKTYGSAQTIAGLNVDNVMDEDILSSNVVGLIGEPTEITSDIEIDANNPVTIEGIIHPSEICDALGTSDVDMNDIGVLYYNEEQNCYEIIESTISDSADEDTKNMSFNVANSGTYMLISISAWINAWNKSPKYQKDDTIDYNTVLTIDCSTSMNGNRITSVKKSVESYINKQMKNNDTTAIVSFTGTATEEVGFSTDKDSLKSNITDLNANGGTNIYAGLGTSIDLFLDDESNLNSNNNNIIILLSDGEDGSDLKAFDALLQKAKDNNIVIYTIALDSGADKDKLNYIATKTGGCLIEIDTLNMTETDKNTIFAPIEDMKGINTTTDNKDGLPDCYEKTGIQLTNGQIISANELKTYTQNESITDEKTQEYQDTDNDGLLNGEEIQVKYLSKYIFSDSVNQPNSGKLAFVMKSDPTKQDSDEDGLEDMYDPQTLIFNVIYNRNNAIEYALTWAGDGSNEIYNDQYYHRGADCANFVSQCVYYGGYVMNSEWFMTRFKDETITLPQEKMLSKFKGTYTENGWE